MPLYQFTCSHGHVNEALRPMSVTMIPCTCGVPALRVAAYRVAITGPQVDSRNMYRRYDEASQEMAHVAERTGTESPHGGLWQAAKQRARAMVAAGEISAPTRKD